jgi:hypothetical protein
VVSRRDRFETACVVSPSTATIDRVGWSTRSCWALAMRASQEYTRARTLYSSISWSRQTRTCSFNAASLCR